MKIPFKEQYGHYRLKYYSNSELRNDGTEVSTVKDWFDPDEEE